VRKERLSNLLAFPFRGFRSDRFNSASEIDANVTWNPAVAILDHSFWNELRPRTEKDGRAAGLQRFRPAPERIEIDELAVVFGNVLSPDLLIG
jgi:hypothetical protein